MKEECLVVHRGSGPNGDDQELALSFVAGPDAW